MNDGKRRFAIGDKVMHYKHGAGEITRLDHRELVEGFENYYVIDMNEKNSTLYIPVGKSEELGIRPVMSPNKLGRVLDTLQDVPDRLSGDFKKRQGRIREKLASSHPVQVAEAVRDLYNRGYKDRLTKVDRDLLEEGKDLLANEIAAVTETQMMEAHKTIQTALTVAVNS